MNLSAKIVSTEKVSLRTNPEFNERMIQEMIVSDPAILGLGDVVVKDVERTQPRAGRLDLLLQEIETTRRYEVEIQLGATDEAHIIRTIEYWDIERRRYPQYEHCAVIIAEDITSRFLNVISMFNGAIPLIAIQMNAFKVGDQVALHFTKILDEFNYGLVEEDEATHFVADRNYWEERSSKLQLKVVDEIFGIVTESYANLELNYNKLYIGVRVDGRANNFVNFKPKKQHVIFEVKVPESDEMSERIDASGLERNTYNKSFKHYPIRIEKGDVAKHRDFLKDLIRIAYEERFSS